MKRNVFLALARQLSDTGLLYLYSKAYASASLYNIRGSLRTPSGSLVLGDNLTPEEAFDRLLQWWESGISVPAATGGR